MSGNSLVLVGQSSRFSSPAMGQPLRLVPSSPMVLQMLVQTLANLSQKVDALATRPPQVVEVRPVEVRQVEVQPPAEAPQQKVDRKTLWSIFD